MSTEESAALLTRGSEYQTASLALELQQSHGNAYVQRLLESIGTQAKLVQRQEEEEEMQTKLLQRQEEEEEMQE